MPSIAALQQEEATPATWRTALAELGPKFAARAAAADEGDRFVADNYRDLRAGGLIEAGVPAELGGGGAGVEELGAMLRELARHCSSTALAFSMHTHQVAAAAWRWRHQKAPLEALLKRVAAERIVLLSSGGSDWLHGSGTATKVEGGFRINARKAFASGAPASDLLMTSAVYEDPQAGPTVLHFGVPMKAPGVSIAETWRALGMRGTGSHDVLLSDLFVTDAQVSLRRPKGKWHMLYHVVVLIAIPLIYSVYLGVAEAARTRAVQIAGKRRSGAHLVQDVGALETELHAARIAVGDMIAAAVAGNPGFETTRRIMAGRALAARAVLATASLAMDVAGGAGFYRDQGLERLFRDAQGARFHPLPDGVQRELAGRLALGLDPDAAG